MTLRPLADRAPWVLALDAGSSSVRSALFDRAGRPLDAEPAARVSVSWRAAPAGAMEADADALLDACARAVDAAVARAREAGIEIAAVAPTTFWHGVMGVDAAGAPLTPLFGWGDTRAREDAAWLRARVDADAAHRRTGCFVHESYPAAKLVWLRRTTGDTFPRAAAWLSLGEHLGERWLGARRASLSMASGTGLFDARRMGWDAEVLDAIGLGADRLPEVSDEPPRGLVPEMARRWPELAAVPWYPAVGDGACATLGSGAVGAGRVALTVGTSAAVRVLRGEAGIVVPDGLWCYRLDGRRTVCGRALSNGGNVLAWLRRTLALPLPDELERALLAMEPGSHGLTVVPTLVGERPPLSDPPGASVQGLTLDTTVVEIARAWMEAVAGGIGGAVRAVEAAFGPAAEVVASGGALHGSPAFARIVADAVGRPMRLRPTGEETARGAALLALERLGAIPDAVAFAAAELDEAAGAGGAGD